MTDTEAAAIRSMAEAHRRTGYLEGLILALLEQIENLPPLATPDETAELRAMAAQVRSVLGEGRGCAWATHLDHAH